MDAFSLVDRGDGFVVMVADPPADSKRLSPGSFTHAPVMSVAP
jgi:hypothetical protein